MLVLAWSEGSQLPFRELPMEGPTWQGTEDGWPPENSQQVSETSYPTVSEELKSSNNPMSELEGHFKLPQSTLQMRLQPGCQFDRNLITDLEPEAPS